MNIDKRYLMILADNAPYKTNKWLRRIGFIALFIVIASAFLLTNALYRPIENPEMQSTAVKMMNAGLILSGIGIIALIISLYFKNRDRRIGKRNFMDYWDKNAALPPWPEDEKGERNPIL